MRNLFRLGLGMLAFSLFMVACQKEEVKEEITNEEQSIQSAEDLTESEAAFEDAFDIVEAEAQQHDELTGLTTDKGAEVRNNCAEVTMKKNEDGTSIFPVVITMDYGDGCTTDRGREISGKMIITFSDRIRKPQATRTITFDNFMVNGFKVSGTKTITNNGLNDQEQFNYTVSLEGGSVESPDGKVVKHEFSRTRTWVDGMDTNFKTDGISGVLDDVWEVTGSASGVNRNGVSYTAVIDDDNPLRRENDCRWITKGKVTITTDRLPEPGTIDYGDGTCDNKAVITVGERSKEIELPKKR